MWKLGDRLLQLDRPVMVGILNVTPDSFSDGGRFDSLDEAVVAGLGLVANGADIVDVGGESTRPGSMSVPEGTEMDRVVPVIVQLVSAGVTVSVDTMKPAVAEAAVNAGASVINDVSGFEHPEMRRLASRTEVGLVVMHMQGSPRTMQDDPRYEDVVAEVEAHLRHRADLLVESGCDARRIAVDPGIGFGKTFRHNLELIDGLDVIARIGYPVMLGTSRKGFLGEITGRPVLERDAATATTVALAVERGASIFRVHDPASAREAATIAWAIVGRNPEATEESETP